MRHRKSIESRTKDAENNNEIYFRLIGVCQAHSGFFLKKTGWKRIEISPRTKPIFAIFEPITLFIAMEGELFNAALTLTINSGSDVAKETTVIPITNLEILNFNDNATDDLTINSPPTTNKRKPKKMKIIFIYLIIILEYITL